MPPLLDSIGKICIVLGEIDNAETYLNKARQKLDEIYPDQSCHCYLALIINGTMENGTEN